MAALNTPGLNRWERMQQQPVGGMATSMAAPSPAQSAYKRLASDYGQALRTLRRAGRRGDARATLGAIGLQQDALDRGIQGIQGIRRSEDQQVAAQGFEDSLGQAATAQEQVNRRAMGGLGGQDQPRLGVQGATGAQGSTGVQGASGLQGASQQPRLGAPASPSMRAYDDSDGGDRLAENRSQIAQRGFVDRVRSGLEQRGGTLTSDERKNLQAKPAPTAEGRKAFLDNVYDQIKAGRIAPDEAYETFKAEAGELGMSEKVFDSAYERIQRGAEVFREGEAAARALGGVGESLDAFKEQDAKKQAAQNLYDEFMSAANDGKAPPGSPKKAAPVASAQEQIAAANREASEAAPDVNPFVPAGNAELAGSMVAGGVRLVGDRLEKAAERTGEDARAIVNPLVSAAGDIRSLGQNYLRGREALAADRARKAAALKQGVTRLGQDFARGFTRKSKR